MKQVSYEIWVTRTNGERSMMFSNLDVDRAGTKYIGWIAFTREESAFYQGARVELVQVEREVIRSSQ